MYNVKRNFSSIQSAHTVPMNNMRAPYVRTGYESIFAIRSGKKFVIPAEDNGKVVSVTKNKITVEYDNLGKKSYIIKNWTSKEESHSCYTHIMVPNLKVGDKFIKDDTLVYDKLFFEPDIFNPKRVIIKLGTTCNLCFMEDQQTYEDSAAISSKMNKLMGCKVTKVISTIVNCEDNILNIVKVGDTVEPETVLYTSASKVLGEQPSAATSKLLESISKNTPKAKYRGTVTKVIIYYNCELNEISKTLRDEVMKSDEELVNTVGYNGRVTSSYSTSGRKLLPKDVEIKIYIDIDEDMSIGDKMILGNQMKCTVGEVFNNDIRAEDGREIDAMFSYRSIGNRIVCSMNLIGTTSTILEKVQENAVDIYFK